MPHQDDLAQLFRAGSGKILAALTAQCHDLQMAEDALQEAFVQATEMWAKNTIPDTPHIWLLTVARRRLIDRLRQSSRHCDSQTMAAINASLASPQNEAEDAQPIPDERLRLIFTCCHPALKQEAQIALTLKTLCGLSAREIARAYLVSEPTMNQRLVRAKQKIRQAGIAYKVPKGSALAERLDSVLAVIYLIYNESYSAFEGQSLTRNDLAEEAIRLARLLQSLMPEAEASGLLALLLLHQAREPARSSDTKGFIPLEHQARNLWNKQKISEGRSLLVNTLSQGKPGKYQLQAAISALHSEATSWQRTDWQQIYLLYLTLYETDPSPIVKLNGLVAMAQTGRVQEALSRLDEIAVTMQHYQPFYAAKAEMETRLGLISLAKRSYQNAIKLSKNTAEKEFLSKCLAKLSLQEK